MGLGSGKSKEALSIVPCADLTRDVWPPRIGGGLRASWLITLCVRRKGGGTSMSWVCTSTPEVKEQMLQWHRVFVNSGTSACRHDTSAPGPACNFSQGLPDAGWQPHTSLHQKTVYHCFRRGSDSGKDPQRSEFYHWGASTQATVLCDFTLQTLQTSKDRVNFAVNVFDDQSYCDWPWLPDHEPITPVWFGTRLESLPIRFAQGLKTKRTEHAQKCCWSRD